MLVGFFYGQSGGGECEEAQREAERLLDFVGLARQADRPVSSLNLMERKIVELARALATRPKLLLLDELLAGLNPLDLDPAIAIIRRIRDELGVTVFWIEHIMQVLMKTCEHLIVLHHGEKLAEGTPQTVAADRRWLRHISERKERAALSELLSVQNIDVRYGDVQVVWGCSLEIREGEVVALFGGNGAGKTTHSARHLAADRCDLGAHRICSGEICRDWRRTSCRSWV